MSQQYDITRHIDYENHMKNYISKAEAKKIIDNLKTQLLNNPIQSHPDFPALVRSLEQKHQRELSRLEQDLRKKLSGPASSIQPIQRHPDYQKLVSSYENKIRAAAATAKIPQRQEPSFSGQRACPVCPACPSAPECPPPARCPPQPKCPSAPRCPECSMEFSLAQTLKDALTEEPTAYNDYALGKSKSSWWRGI